MIQDVKTLLPVDRESFQTDLTSSPVSLTFLRFFKLFYSCLPAPAFVCNKKGPERRRRLIKKKKKTGL